MLAQASYPECGVPSLLWEGEPPLSIVERMEDLLERKFGDIAEPQLQIMIDAARRNMAARRIEEAEEAEQQELNLGKEEV